jgi:hypothetical protein
MRALQDPHILIRIQPFSEPLKRKIWEHFLIKYASRSVEFHALKSLEVPGEASIQYQALKKLAIRVLTFGSGSELAERK